MRVSIFSVHKDRTKVIEDKLADLLLTNGFIIDDYQPEVVIVVGGDGTFLKAVKFFKDSLDDIKFIGVNIGVLGFLYDYEKNELQELIDDLKGNNLFEKDFPLVEGIITSGEEEEHIFALNEIRIFSNIDCFESDVFVNDEFLEHYIGNGLLVCSSIGSTALAKSLGGSILSYDTNLLELVPMVPLISNVYSPLSNPLILNDNSIIRLEGNLNNALLAFDNQVYEDDIDILEIRLSNQRVKFLLREEDNCITKIRRGFIK